MFHGSWSRPSGGREGKGYATNTVKATEPQLKLLLLLHLYCDYCYYYLKY